MSVEEYGSIIDTTDSDLTRFQKAGGKMITWHGSLDQFIPKQGVVSYYEKVKEISPDVEDFYRLFLAPGVGHCGGGIGYFPESPLAAIAAWVEKGEAPDKMPASSLATGWEQPLCVYPKVAKWDGVGNVSVATSFSCADSY
jgi:hypothetical protein